MPMMYFCIGFDTWSVTPNRLYELCGDKMFAKLRLRDKAGNFTTQPLIVPLPPRVPKQ